MTNLGLAAGTGSFLLCLFAGCTSSETGPSDCSAVQDFTSQVVICNHAGSFSYGYQALASTKSDSWPWKNPGTMVHVAFGGHIASGTVTIKIQDASGRDVYDESWTRMGQVGSAAGSLAGTAGMWTILLELHSVGGQVGFVITTA